MSTIIVDNREPMRSIGWHTPSQNEIEIIKKYNDRQEKRYRHIARIWGSIYDIRITYIRQGNFIICKLQVGKHQYFGVSKRNPGADEEHITRGMHIALYRALSTNQYIDGY
jgi:hypothetical protein